MFRPLFTLEIVYSVSLQTFFIVTFKVSKSSALFRLLKSSTVHIVHVRNGTIDDDSRHSVAKQLIFFFLVTAKLTKEKVVSKTNCPEKDGHPQHQRPK
jgi:hypothetical protein